MVLHDHLNESGNFVALESRVAELADPPFEGLRILRHERRYFGCNDLAGDRIRLTADGNIFDIIDLEEDILDFGRMHLLAAHIYQFRLAAENTNVVSVSFVEILLVEPAIYIEQ